MKSNSKLKEALRTHLIGDAEKFGVLNNDYGNFLTQRSALIAEKLTSKLNPAVNGADFRRNALPSAVLGRGRGAR